MKGRKSTMWKMILMVIGMSLRMSLMMSLMAFKMSLIVD